MLHPVRFASLACLLISATAVRAEVRPHALIADGMVLQQEKPVRLWGTAASGESVAVEFRGHAASTIADAAGRWQLELPSQTAGGPYPMVIRGTNEVRLKDVYVGEVWVCSGQSNMGWPVANRPGSKELLGTENPRIRLFTVPQRMLDEPATDLVPDDAGRATWRTCGPESLVGFSAVAYYFGRELAETRKVPIGLIHTSYGGSSVEQWIERDALAATKPKDAAPARPGGRVVAPTTSKLYNGMIAPLIPYGMRGVIWYQGEADVRQAALYRRYFTALIENWRREWRQGSFPFLFVQIAPFGKIVDSQPTSNSALLRDQQLEVSRTVADTAMAVITDWGHETDIHVKQKQPVAHRLALLARRLVYGETDLEAFGPQWKQTQIQGREAVVRFDHAAGLTAKTMVLENFSTDSRTGYGGALHVTECEPGETVPLIGFEIAGRDGKFVPANATIQADTVVVSSAEVPEPAVVRYGWADYPRGNLFNGAGLPAVPFGVDGSTPSTAPPPPSRR